MQLRRKPGELPALVSLLRGEGKFVHRRAKGLVVWERLAQLGVVQEQESRHRQVSPPLPLEQHQEQSGQGEGRRPGNFQRA